MGLGGQQQSTNLAKRHDQQDDGSRGVGLAPKELGRQLSRTARVIRQDPKGFNHVVTNLFMQSRRLQTNEFVTTSNAVSEEFIVQASTALRQFKFHFPTRYL